MHICGVYDRKKQNITKLIFVLTLPEELEGNYSPGSYLVVGPRTYILTNRQWLEPGVIVHYDLEIQKG